MAENRSQDGMSMFSIEVPPGVIDEKTPGPKNKGASNKAGRKAQQKPVYSNKAPVKNQTGHEQMSLPLMGNVSSAIDEETALNEILDSFSSMERGNFSNEIALDPITEADRTKKKSSRELQRRTTKTKAPARKLASVSLEAIERAKRASRESMPVTELKMPYTENRAAERRDMNDGARAVSQNKKLTRFLSLLLPTHSDGMVEVIRKGLVIISIIILIFSMGILIKSTRLEKKASSENAGNYFVTKYVYSYDIYKNETTGKEK